MAIDRSFESALLKAIQGLEVKQKDLRHPGMAALTDEALRKAIQVPTDERIWALAEGLRRSWSLGEINSLSKVDNWFLDKIQNLIRQERESEPASDKVFKMVDTCAGEFESQTPYYYATRESEDDHVVVLDEELLKS